MSGWVVFLIGLAFFGKPHPPDKDSST